ncbi:MAG: histidine phosphatase family protein [Clostridia bacterium]|nr:histidine phosphatase family protein [Clostridia bacterium]
MRWVLIRHGQTQGNLEHRYIGCRTDEPLCAAGREALRLCRYPAVSRVFASPMRRCIETAAILYPGIRPEIVPDLRECDFGAFEGKNYAELSGRADYQAWIDSGGALPFPGGESRAAFAARCVHAFERLRAQDFREDCALIVHGGTIMAIMERYALPKGGYFDYQVSNGEGFVLNPDGTHERLGMTTFYP